MAVNDSPDTGNTDKLEQYLANAISNCKQFLEEIPKESHTFSSNDLRALAETIALIIIELTKEYDVEGSNEITRVFLKLLTDELHELEIEAETIETILINIAGQLPITRLVVGVSLKEQESRQALPTSPETIIATVRNRLGKA